MNGMPLQTKAKYGCGTVLILLLVLNQAAMAAGGAAGTDHYLLSSEGRLIHRLNTKPGDAVDPVAEMYAHVEKEELTVFHFDNSRAWQKRAQGAKWVCFGPRAIIVTTETGLVGFAKDTGRELYRTDIPWASLAGSWFPKPDEAGPDAAFAYFAYCTQSSEKVEGGMLPVIEGPVTLIKINIETGQRVWMASYMWPRRNDRIRGVEPGIILGDSCVYFDTAMGKRLTDRPPTTRVAAPKNAPAPASAPALSLPAQTSILMYTENIIFALERKGRAPNTLIAFTLQGKEQWRWPIPPAEGMDGESLQVVRCKSAFLVIQKWFRGE
ncbi:MAG: hypothetical protein ABFD92_05100 [Planctomycetaceae bacterium]|nr:hypothetical protein [Planctomycetaceae bacterium]